MKCSTCQTRFSADWLILALPWSKYTCKQCGSVFAGTILRTLLTSIVVGVLGYVLFPVLKGKTSPLFLLPLLAVALVLFLGDLPLLVKRVDQAEQPKEGCREA